MQWIIDGCNFLIISVHGKNKLSEIIRADADEVHVLEQLLQDDCGRRHFEEKTHFDPVIKGYALSPQALTFPRPRLRGYPLSLSLKRSWERGS